MNMTHEVVKVGTFWAVKNTDADRVLSTRFKTKTAAHDFAGLIEDPEELDKEEITIAEVARHLKIEAFRARAALRKLGMKPETGRWKIIKDSPEHHYIVSILKKIAKK